MAEQSTITLSGLPNNGDDITATDGQVTALTQIVDEFNKQVPLTKISGEQAWTTYVPAWTGSSSNPAIGNGTLTGRYVRMGRFIHCVFDVVAGTTTTFGSGEWSFSLPVTGITTNTYTGSVRIKDDSTNTRYVGVALISTTTTIQIETNAVTSPLTSAVPFTWATSDSLRCSFTYEAASA